MFFRFIFFFSFIISFFADAAAAARFSLLPLLPLIHYFIIAISFSLRLFRRHTDADYAYFSRAMLMLSAQILRCHIYAAAAFDADDFRAAAADAISRFRCFHDAF